jgi:hypothetical protein
MADKTEPTTNAGRALAAWNRRSRTMAETIARIEAEAVEEWLRSPEAEQRLADALAKNVDCTPEGLRYDVRALLASLRRE